MCDISSLRVNGPSEPGRLRDVCVCQWVKRKHDGEGQLRIWKTVPSRTDQALRLKLVDRDAVCKVTRDRRLEGIEECSKRR